jgi:gluconate 2-dehydrogenase gamma chain
MESIRGGAGARGISRRELLKRAGLAGAAAAVPAGVLAGETAAAAPEREQLEAFTSDEAATVEAIVERLIPTDASGPGAAEGRVARYIDRALSGELSALAPFYSAGLGAVDDHAEATYGARFTALSAEQQDVVLSAFEAGTVTPTRPAPGAGGTVPISASAFFETIREHALQGMFGDPYHGGNANFVGWDLVGFPGIKLSFTAREQRLDVAVRRAHKSTTDYPIFGVSKRKETDHGH